MLKFFILICLLMVTRNGIDGKVGRIFGGIEVTSNTTPNYQVAVLGPINMCSGSIIRLDFVLTAATCINNIDPLNLDIRVGSVQYFVGGIEAKAASTQIHPKFNGVNKDFNVGVIKLTAPLNSADLTAQNIAIIGLATTLPAPSSAGFLTGYGAETSTNSLPNYMKITRLEIFTPTLCKNLYGTYILQPEMYCAGDSAGEKDACKADEGGPLMNNGSQIGIYSHGGRCGGVTPTAPVFVSIPVVRSWILFATGQ